MENFNFNVSTDIRFGKDRLAELPSVLNQFGKNVLLVYGGGSIKRSGLYEKIKTLLKENGLKMFELGGVDPNPKIESVREGVMLCKHHKIDVILAVGGGSVIDCSKVISGAVFYEGDPWEMVLSRRYEGPTIPLVTILTLAATGTEMNRGAVISDLNAKQKLGIHGTNFLPKVSFLDPSLTFSVSKYQTLAGSADILSHLMEQYFNLTPGTEVQDSIAEGLMKTVIQCMPVALHEPTHYDARANLMWASTLALNGLVGSGRKGAWSCHAMEHELSAFYDITHGIGLAILTPRWLDYILNEQTLPKIERFARNVWQIQEPDSMKAAKMGIQALYDFFEENGVPMTLPEVGIPDDRDFAVMAQQAIDHSSLLTDSFEVLGVKDVVAIYQACLTKSKFI